MGSIYFLGRFRILVLLIPVAIIVALFVFELPPQRQAVESFAAVDPFLDLVGPMFELRCSNCHNDDERKGELVLTSFDDMMRGGETPLTDAQVQIIEWWIAAGLPHEITMDQVELQPDSVLENLIRAELGLVPGAASN